jgi:nitroreductase
MSPSHRNSPYANSGFVTEIREEDYAAGMMAAHNITLAAVALGLGTHIKSGAVMDDPAARAAVGVADGDRIIATINLGEPATVPSAKPLCDRKL